jgi:hypothetical protein
MVVRIFGVGRVRWLDNFWLTTIVHKKVDFWWGAVSGIRSSVSAEGLICSVHGCGGLRSIAILRFIAFPHNKIIFNRQNGG